MSTSLNQDLAALAAYVKTSPQQPKINPNNKNQKPKLTLKPGRTLQVADTAALKKLYCEASTQLLYDKWVRTKKQQQNKHKAKREVLHV